MRQHDASAPVEAVEAEPVRGAAAGGTPERVLALQRAAGNRATTRALARDGLGDWWHAVDVNAVDPKGLVGTYSYWANKNTVTMRSVGEMVRGVLELIGSEDRIKRLNILDHGGTNGVQFGDELLHAGNVDLVQDDFKRLRGKFTPGGYVQLWNCKAGSEHLELLKLLAQYMQVRVVAGKGYQHAFGFNTQDYVDVLPDGRVSEHTFGPGLR